MSKITRRAFTASPVPKMCDNKRKSDHLSPPPLNDVQKRYLYEPLDLIKKNKFFTLQTMEVSDANPDTQIPSTSNVETPTENKPKIPPLFLPVVNYSELLNDLSILTKNPFTTSSNKDRTRINLSTIDDFRAVTKFYTDSKISYYTYQDAASKPLSVVIKNIPPSLSEDDVKLELISIDLPVIKITRLLNKEKLPTLIVAVELTNNDKGKEIFKIEKICHAIVKIEPRKYGQSIPQCYRCQRYGHTRNYCKMDYRCVKCLGNHSYKECTKAATDPPICVNCNNHHPANYRGCKMYQDLHNVQQNRSTRTQNNRNIETTQDRTRPTRFVTPNVDTSYRSYANVTRTHSNPNQTNPEPSTTSTTLVQQVINFLMNLITPHIETIKKYFVDNILPNFFYNGTR